MNLGDRLGVVRTTFGANGPRTSGRGFAREAGVNYRRYASWEREERMPRGGSDVISAAFANVEGIKRAGVDPRALALWVVTGDGEMPRGGGGGNGGGVTAGGHLQPAQPFPVPPGAARYSLKLIQDAMAGQLEPATAAAMIDLLYRQNATTVASGIPTDGSSLGYDEAFAAAAAELPTLGSHVRLTA